MNSSISSRVSALRVFLKDHGLNGWIVPTADPHLSEYVDEHYAFRKWLSGFTGSAGSLLVTQDAAALVTDSRYWVQAEQQLEGSGIELVKLNQGYAARIRAGKRSGRQGISGIPHSVPQLLCTTRTA